MTSLATSSARILTMSRAEFYDRFGTPNVDGALCGYTREVDTQTVLTLLVHARPRRVLEVGTALGHMTANLTRWTADDAEIFTIGIVQGMARAAPGAAAQQGDVPGRADWGRFADQFGQAHKGFFITADTMRYDFGRLAPLDFVFIDGGHDFEHVQNDSRKSYDALAPGGWLVWHDFNSPVPWVKVREAIEKLGFAEPVVHIEGTEVAFLRKKGGSEPCRVAGAEAYSPVPQGEWAGPGTPVASVPAGDLLHSHPEPGAIQSTKYESSRRIGGVGGKREPVAPSVMEAEGTCPQMTQMDADKRGNDREITDRGGKPDAAPGEQPGDERSQSLTGSLGFHLRPSASSADREAIATRVRVTWEGDVEGLHSLAIVNRALCMALIERGHDLGLVTGTENNQIITPERLPLDPRLAERLGRGPEGGPAHPRK